MVSHQMMIRILKKMSTDPEPIDDLSDKLGIHKPNLRRSLKAMVELGLVEKVKVRSGNRIRVGWKKRYQ